MVRSRACVGRRRAVICRKCGEPDRRGSAADRRRSRQRLLNGENGLGGNGVITVCIYCLTLLSNAGGGSFEVVVDGKRRYLPVERLERDRLMGCGSPYAFWNLAPACGPCNRARTYAELEIPDGCAFGPETVEKVEALTKRQRTA